MHTFLLSAENWYLVCFGIGLVLSLLTFFGGFGHLHFGHMHGGHLHLGHSHAGHAHAPGVAGGHDASISPFNGFTLMAFLCWFGGTGYLMHRFTGVLGTGYPRHLGYQRPAWRGGYLLVSRSCAAAQRARAHRRRNGDDRRARTRLESHPRRRHR